nr:WTK protein [Aegilops sharonensis]
MDGYEFERAEIDALERVVRDPREKPISLSFWLLRRITNDFSNASEIGRGGFSNVYLGVLPSGLRIAVKKLYQLTALANEFEDEVLTTMRVAHKNIVRLIGYCRHTQSEVFELKGESIFAQVRERLICTEYVPNGTLDGHITDKFHGGLDWDQRYQVLKGICHGLHYLHDEIRVIHRDIKTENILLDDNGVPKVFDFGFSKCLPDGESLIKDEATQGTLGYLAPESVDKQEYSFKSDIYSFGVVIIQLLTGSWISKNRNVELELKELRKRLVREGAFPSWENKYHQVRTCLEIVYNCMDIDPDKRPTALEIIQRLDETESANYSVSSGHATPLWQSGDEESDSAEVDAFEPERTPSKDILSDDEEPASADANGETSTQKHNMPDLVSKQSVSAELSSLDFLEKITDGFSYEQILGKESLDADVHKAFLYEGSISGPAKVVVKRLIGVAIPVAKFKRDAEQLMSLDHKNIVKLLGYCHDESRGHKLVQFKAKPPQDFKGAEQLLCYEYMHNGSLREYLTGQGSREVDWHMCYKLIKGTCEGLRYLHEGCGDRPILHLNLNPSNILLDENNIPRITGFDFSKLIGEKNTKSVVLKKNGPLGYLPPDFLYSKGTDLKYLPTVDIYSLGLIILEIATRQEIKGDHGIIIRTVETNWRQDTQIATLYGSLEDKLREQVKMCIDIGLDCVKSNPKKRPTAGAIMLWLDKGSKPGVARPPLRDNVTHADDHIQEKEKQTPLRRFFRRK